MTLIFNSCHPGASSRLELDVGKGQGQVCFDAPEWHQYYSYISNFNTAISLKINEIRQEIFNITKTMKKSIDEIFSTLQIISKNNKIFLDFKNEFNDNFNIQRFDDKVKLNLSILKKDFDKKFDQIEKF